MFDLSTQAIAKAAALDNRPIHLLVWPETMFRSPLRSFEPGFKMPADAPNTIEQVTASGPRDLASLAARLGVPILVGVDRLVFLAGDGTADTNARLPALQLTCARRPRGKNPRHLRQVPPRDVRRVRPLLEVLAVSRIASPRSPAPPKRASAPSPSNRTASTMRRASATRR